MSYKLMPEDVSVAKEMRLSGSTYFEIGEKLGISFQHAQAICTGKRKVLTSSSCLKDELFLLVESFPCLEASNLGRIRRIETKRIYTPRVDPRGYNTIGFSYLRKKYTKFIHRLVAEAHLGNCPEKYTVNHKDGNKSNNHVDNLEYVTQAQNNQHAYDINLRTAEGENNGRSKLTENDVRKIRQMRSKHWTYVQIAKEMNISMQHAQAICTRRFWNHVS